MKWILCVRFWNKVKNKVDDHYPDSIILEHCTCSDLLETFSKGVWQFDWNKFLQVSMDWLDLSLRFKDEIFKEGNKEDFLGLLNIGTYSLHDIHGACRMGCEASACKMKRILKAAYIFQESSTCLEDCIDITGLNIFQVNLKGISFALKDIFPFYCLNISE